MNSATTAIVFVIIAVLLILVLVACSGQSVPITPIEQQSVEQELGMPIDKAIEQNREVVIDILSKKLNAHVADVRIVDGIVIAELVPMGQEMLERGGKEAVKESVNNPSFSGIAKIVLSVASVIWGVSRTRRELANRVKKPKTTEPVAA